MMRNKVFSLHSNSFFLKNKFILSFFIIVVFVVQAYSQQQTQKPLPCLEKKFNVIVHIVNDSLEEANVSLADIQNGFNEMNGYFEEICVSFKICEVRYIENFQYDRLNFEKEGDEMDVFYHDEYRINMHFIKEFTDGAAGRATLGGIARQNKNNIWIVKSDNMGGTMAHEMGHFFGLQHTFEVTQVGELVDGSNCATSGDSLCDTPADPFVFGSSPEKYVNDDCEFDAESKDANGQYYDPDVKNIMSYYPCACRFSYQQYEKMARTYLSNTDMW